MVRVDLFSSSRAAHLSIESRYNICFEHRRPPYVTSNLLRIHSYHKEKHYVVLIRNFFPYFRLFKAFDEVVRP